LNKEKHNTKLSRRLFSQYFMSAIIPVLVFSLISFYTVSDLLKKNANRQIYAESRAVGLTIYDRILTAESNLLNLSKRVEDNKLIKSDDWSKKIYSSLYIIDLKGSEEIIFGEKVSGIELSDVQLKHLKNNKRLLLISGLDDNQAQILMLHALSNDNDQILVAILNPNYLWNITTKESDIYCVSVEHRFLLHCPQFKYQADNYQVLKEQLISVRSSNLQEISLNEEVYLSNIWDVFLEANFNMNSMSVIYLMPKKNALLEYDYYIDALPLSIAMTLLIVFIISSIQMRRSLMPLMKLTQGAKNIIAGDYSKTVEIKSNDEFEVLGSTFNSMIKKIDSQFKKIETLSQIDRFILSTSDTDYIVGILIEYIPSVIPADNIAILILDVEKKNRGALSYNNKSNMEIVKTDLILDETELNELNDSEEILYKTDSDVHSYLSPLMRLGNTDFFVSPIREQDNILGAICIGFHENIEVNQEITDVLAEISARAAVAISNANWEKKLFHQAHYDSLTQLPNRFLFQDRLEQAIERAKRNNLNVAILFIDLDRFKSVNDSLGHAIGDKLLNEVSKVLQKCTRLYDSVARFGGDEFTIILSDLKDDEVDEKIEKLSNRILNFMTESIVIDDREFNITPSIGIAIFPQDANNIMDLLKNADTAMYEAKSISTGKGNYQYYKKQQNNETLAKLELETDLRHALSKEQFELYYQPKINIHDSMIHSVEALIRWHHPEQGMVSPGVFIPIAEEIGLITDIGYWVMRAACKQSRLWNDNGIQLNIAINVSTDQFRQPKLYEKIIAILDETKVDPETIELEITESSTIENFPKTIKLLNQFKEHGLKISIDDFGTGYSSMTYLQKIPIDELKIDKSFIDNIQLNDDSASITKAIVALGHSLSLTVVAEGVETKAQYDFLDKINCDEAQGFFLSRPLPESELIQHILLYNIKSEIV
jgi:diguanylate cyclase (GGDEF)-like protein